LTYRSIAKADATGADQDKTKPGMGDRNAELIAAVLAELKAANPEGLRNLSLRLEDDSFVLHRSAGKVAIIRDFRHAAYVVDGAEFLV
jgi:hypothetical protein